MKRFLVISVLVFGLASPALSQTNNTAIKPDAAGSERIVVDDFTQNIQEILRDLQLNLEQLNLGQLQQQIKQELDRVNDSLPEIREMVDGVLSKQEEIRQQVDGVNAGLPEINTILQEARETIKEVLKDLKADSAQ